MCPATAWPSRPSQISAAGQIEAFGLSPKGERALFAARGDIFTAPIEKGATRNLTRSSNAHDKAPEWSPDGRRIVFISDRSGEEELYLIGQDGTGQPEQLTTGGKAMRYRPRWSPDGKRIAFSDKDGKLYAMKLEDKSVVEVDDEPRGLLLDYHWSPDGQWLAYSRSTTNRNTLVHIWSAAENKTRRLHGDLFDEENPVWDPEGNYLYYTSTREFAPLISNLEWNYAGARSRSIFALALRKDVKHPYGPESDEVTIDSKEKTEAAKKTEDAKTPAVPVIKIDFEGLSDRVARVPVAPGNYGSLEAIKGHLCFVRSGNAYYGRDPETRPALVVFSHKDRKETVLSDDAAGYALSENSSKVLVRQGNAYQLYETKPGGTKKIVSTAGLVVDRIPRQEWTQMFNEVWRRYRDFFYVENMHGYDWEKLRVQYAPLLEYAGHRSDLNYIIGEMISELNVGHAYIAGGDAAMPARPRVALPGARFEVDESAGRYRIAKIFAGNNEEPVYRSPLTEVGIDARVGDYVLAIDGAELAANENPYRLLRGKADRPVRLTLNSSPTRTGAREVTFQPIASETDLVYLEMVTRNRERVEKLTGGRVGYLHVPNMGADGIREFIKYFYPQITKEGLIVDVRANGGGNVSQMLIERLRRQLLATGFARTNDGATTYPSTMFNGHMVCLLNETSASDGDIFPAMFRQAGLGPLIGKRSWGGVTGITNRGNLIDGGQVNVPEFGFASPEGKWIIEGHGVDPDIVVENDPKSVIEGRDPQLERGVAEVLQRIRQNPKQLPKRPAPPVKTR